MNDELLMDLETHKWKDSIPSFTLIESQRMTDNEKIISVLVSVYNKESGLKKCLDSIVSQSLGIENIELIIVDDKSTDASLEIAKEFVEKYPNIKLYCFKKNSGSPAAPRNLGFIKATGEYILVQDGDDWLDERGLEKLLEIAKLGNADFARGAVPVIIGNGEFERFAGWHSSYGKYTHLDIKDLPMILNFLGPQGKIMKRSLILENNLHFPNMKFSEDKKFYFDVISLSQSLAITDEIVTYWNRKDDNKDSLVSMTDAKEKMLTTALLLEYVLLSKMNNIAKISMLRRLVEYDFIGKHLNPQKVIKSSKPFELLKEILGYFQIIENYGYKIKEIDFQDELNARIAVAINQKQFNNAFDFIKYKAAGKPGIKRVIGNQEYLVPNWERELEKIELNITASLLELVQVNSQTYQISIDIVANEKIKKRLMVWYFLIITIKILNNIELLIRFSIKIS